MMKSFALVLVCCLFSLHVVYSQKGFSSIEPLTPINISESTKDKPQAKTWNYAGKWWCVLSVASGTKVFRLDDVSWTDVLTLNAKSAKPDCIVDGELVHILFYKGAGNKSFLYTIKFDAASNNYNLWNDSQTYPAIVFPEGSGTVTLAVDNTRKVWVASNGKNRVNVWWSSAPYTAWSKRITVADGISDSDICVITALSKQSKIGVFWSNQTSKRFGFKTHADDSDPQAWSEDEVPASQSAIPGAGGGMADDHMNIKVATDGTLFCAAKSDYNRDKFPKVILLVRHPSGQWDNAYTVTMEPEGTQPVVLLNEKKGSLKVVYTTRENGGDIVYRESAINNISFGPAINLMHSAGVLYNYASSTHQNYNPEIVILATNTSSSPWQAAGVIASDETVFIPPHITFKPSFQSFPNPFSSGTTISFTLPYADDYTLTVYNGSGMKQLVLSKGHAKAGIQNTVAFKRGSMANGIYLVTLQGTKSRQTIKVEMSN